MKMCLKSNTFFMSVNRSILIVGSLTKIFPKTEF